MIPGGLARAIRQLTVLPVGGGRGAAAGDGRDTVWFPAVGLVVGLPVYAVLLLPMPELPRAAIAVAVGVAMTGGLHEDGAMDSADAAFAVADRERRLEILKDPRAGAHAVTAGGILLLLRFAALAAVPAVAVLVAAVAGRWLMALTLACIPSARRDGLGARYAAGARVLPATLVALVLLSGLAPIAGLARTALAIALALAGGLLAGGFLARRFGGLTGDGHGAAGLVAELAALYAFLPVVT